LPTQRVSTQQIKAARALLEWSQRRLAEASGVSAPTIKRLESQAGGLGGRADTAARIVAALESAGVEFIAADGGGPGVRLRKGRKPETIALEDLNASNDE
jgi:transcriptional regulator with XRE-family HTH domain